MPSLADIPAPSAAPASPEPVPAAPAPAAEASPGVPSPFLEVVQGAVPLVIVPPVDPATPLLPEQEIVLSSMPDLLAAGLDFVDASDSSTVFFNPDKITEAEILKADKDGTLVQLVAPPASEAPAGVAGVPLPAPAPSAGPAVGSTAVTFPGVNRTRLANVTPPKPIAPNPIPNMLAKRAV